ncbi:hypothetical protein LTR74_008271 [Friedmanniomyces endolithicus]|nr:hypothetical protein LTR74_008271 [Friedmanniomyces endolithicus]
MQFITLSLTAFVTFAAVTSGAPIGDKDEPNTRRVVVKAEKSTLWAPRDAEVKEVHASVEHPRIAEKSTVWATRDATAKVANSVSKHPAMIADKSTLSAPRNAGDVVEGADILTERHPVAMEKSMLWAPRDADVETESATLWATRDAEAEAKDADVLTERHPVAMEKSTLWAPRDADVETESATLWATRDAGAEVKAADVSPKRPVVAGKATVWAPRDLEAEAKESNVPEQQPKVVEKMTIWARTGTSTNTPAGYIDSASNVDMPAHGEHPVDSHARSAHINEKIIEAIPKRTVDQPATPPTSDDVDSVHALSRSSDIEMPQAPKKIDPRKCWQKGTC